MKALLIGVFFLFVSVLFTWPLAANLRTHVPRGGNDLYQNLWTLWWWKRALFDLGSSPYFSPLLFAPRGLDLAFHTHSPATVLLTMPVNLLFGTAAAYNTACLLSIFLAGLGAYLLCREITGNETAALAGGLFFAVFPQHQEQLFEHLNLLSCQYLPFALFFLIRTLRSGSLRDGLFSGFFFALNALSSWHLGLLGFLAGVPCFCFYLWRSSCRFRALRALAAGALLSAVTVAPFIYPMLKEIAAGATYYKKPLVYRPIDPAFLVLPPPQSTILGGLTKPLYLAHRGNAADVSTAFRFQYAGFICFLGWFPLLVVILLWVRGRRKDLGQLVFWTCLFAGFVVFACGSHLTFLGRSHPSLTLPQGWLAEVSFFRVLRVANRYLIPGSLAFAVLVSMGVSALPGGRLLRSVFLLLCGLEFLWVPFPIKPLERFPAARELGQSQVEGIVMEIPPCLRAAQADAMLRQMIHLRPLAGGYAAVVPPETRKRLLSQPFVQGLTLEKGPGAPPPRLRRSTLRRMAEYGITALIVKPKETREELRRRYEEARRKGELPFFLKHLRPGRALPERRLRLILDQLSRYLDRPAYQDETIEIWLLKKPSGATGR